MKHVGLMCNCSIDKDPKQQLSPSLVNRTFLIGEILAQADIEFFLYSPRDVAFAGDVRGHIVEGRELIPAKRPVPSVNANWTYGTRRLLNKGMGYRKFKRWTRDNEIGIYVPYKFAELVSNKRKAFEVVQGHDESLHPRTEDFVGSTAQLESFLSRSELIFLKPRAGNRGNEIFVLRPDGDEFSLRYYDSGLQRTFSNLTMETALGVVGVAAHEKKYIIQQGVESLRYEGAVFDIRAVMVHDGNRWHSILEIRLAPDDSDVSNVFQGGSIQVPEDLFESMFGKDSALLLGEEIRSVSHGVVKHLESLYPGDLIEVGFDFVLDQERKLHLIEINAKPGVAGFGSEAKIFDWKDEDEPYYEKWVHPHMKHLADFLRSKIEEP